MWLPCCSSNSEPIFRNAPTVSLPETPATSSAGDLNDLFENARRHRVAMLLQALQITFDGLADICGRFRARSALGNTPGQSRTRGHKHPVLVWFQINAIPHYPAF